MLDGTKFFRMFDLEINYIPCPEDLVADALRRWAYPTSSARQDVSLHGSLDACKEMEKMIHQEVDEHKGTAVFKISLKQGIEIRAESVINAITRSQKPPSPKQTVTVPLSMSSKSKPSGQNPATSLPSPKVPFQGFQFTSV